MGAKIASAICLNAIMEKVGPCHWLGTGPHEIFPSESPPCSLKEKLDPQLSDLNPSPFIPSGALMSQPLLEVSSLRRGRPGERRVLLRRSLTGTLRFRFHPPNPSSPASWLLSDPGTHLLFIQGCTGCVLLGGVPLLYGALFGNGSLDFFGGEAADVQLHPQQVCVFCTGVNSNQEL